MRFCGYSKYSIFSVKNSLHTNNEEEILNIVKRALVLTALLMTCVYAQGMEEFLFNETHVLPSDSGIIVYYSYRIPFNRFVFMKDDNGYTANFSIAVEVTDSNSVHIARQIKQDELYTTSFEETNSRDHFYEGVVSFRLKKGRYRFLPIVTDNNSNREMRMRPLFIKAGKEEAGKFYHPIVVNGGSDPCGAGRFRLTNFDGDIPFSEDNFSLIIPSADTSLKSIYVKVISGDDTVYNGSTGKAFSGVLEPERCGGEITINDTTSGIKTRNFIVSGFSRKMRVGKTVILAGLKKGDPHPARFETRVVWIYKPFSLIDPEQAIKLLKFIEPDSVISRLLKEDRENYAKALYDYWKKTDPTPNSQYNPLMNEYYQRIDYAAKNFIPLSGKSGLDTDRGKVYITFGAPQKIERSSNDNGKVIERWIYTNPHRVFEFVDIKGTGNFTLTKK